MGVAAGVGWQAEGERTTQEHIMTSLTDTGALFGIGKTAGDVARSVFRSVQMVTGGTWSALVTPGWSRVGWRRWSEAL